MASISTLTDFLDRLDEADLHYTIDSVREGALMVAVTLESERWEVEFLASGEVEVEIFKSDGVLYDEDVLEELFERAEE